MIADSIIETEPAAAPPACLAPCLDGLAFSATLSMTYLTIVKELVLYQNEHHNWQAAVHRLAMNGYYPLLTVNLIILLWLIWQRRIERRSLVLLSGAAVIFLINVALFSANNVINVLSGHPLHGVHHGIGW